MVDLSILDSCLSVIEHELKLHESEVRDELKSPLRMLVEYRSDLMNAVRTANSAKIDNKSTPHPNDQIREVNNS